MKPGAGAHLFSARKLSRATMGNMKQSLFFAFIYNALDVPSAASVLYPFFGVLLSPMIAAAASRVPAARPAFTKVVGAVWMPGLGVAISGVGFGAITTFIVLLFAQHGWGQAWLALTLLSLAFIIGRVLFGHLPDRVGGAEAGIHYVKE